MCSMNSSASAVQSKLSSCEFSVSELHLHLVASGKILRMQDFNNTWFDFWEYNYHGTVSVGTHDSHQGPLQLSCKDLKAHNQLSLGIIAPLWFRQKGVRRPSIMCKDTSNSLRIGKDASAYITFVLWAAPISLLPLLIKVQQNWQYREEISFEDNSKLIPISKLKVLTANYWDTQNQLPSH